MLPARFTSRVVVVKDALIPVVVRLPPRAFKRRVGHCEVGVFLAGVRPARCAGRGSASEEEKGGWEKM